MPREVIERSIRTRVSVERVCSLLEDVGRTPEWNPLVTRIAPGEGKGRGKGSTVDWEARLAGIKIGGSSVTTAWNPGKAYAWRNTERLTGLSLEGRFNVKPSDGGTELTAIVTYNVPKAVAPLVQRVTVRRLLTAAVDTALRSIGRVAASTE